MSNLFFPVLKFFYLKGFFFQFGNYFPIRINYLDGDFGGDVEELGGDKDGGDEGHGEHVPHHDLLLLGARHPAWDVSVLRAGHVVVLAISTVVSLGDHPCSKTFLFWVLKLKLDKELTVPF